MRYFIELQYDGAAYYGWQRQPDTATVQGTGTVTFRVVKSGHVTALTVDFSKAPVQTLEI